MFETLWRILPSRGEAPNPKKPALLKFWALIKSGVSFEIILKGAQGYAAYCDSERSTGTKFAAQAITWLNQERWTQYQEPTPERRLVAGMG